MLVFCPTWRHRGAWLGVSVHLRLATRLGGLVVDDSSGAGHYVAGWHPQRNHNNTRAGKEGWLEEADNPPYSAPRDALINQ